MVCSHPHHPSPCNVFLIFVSSSCMFFDLMFFPFLPLYMCGAPHSSISGFVPFRPRAPVPEKRDDPILIIIIITGAEIPTEIKERERVEILFTPPKTKKARAGWITAERKAGAGESTARGGQGEGKVRTADFETDDRPKALEVKPAHTHTHTHTQQQQEQASFFFCETANRRTCPSCGRQKKCLARLPVVRARILV